MAKKSGLDFVFDISELFMSDNSFEDVCQKVVDNIVRNFEFSGAFFFLLDKEQHSIYPFAVSNTYIIRKILTLFNISMHDMPISLENDSNLVVKAVNSRRAVVSPDFSGFAPPQALGYAHQVQFLARIKNGCAFPIIYKEEVLGALLVSTRRKTLSDEDLNVIKVFANIAGSAIKNWHLTHALEEKVMSLEKSNKFKSELLEIASHELRTPATAIRDALSLMKPVDESSEEYLSYAKMAAARQIMLVNNILNSSLIEANSFALVKSIFNLSSTIQKIAKELTLFTKEKGIELYTDLPAVCEITADEQKLSQVIYNILYNGIKFTDKGYVKVTLTVVEDMVLIKFIDTGNGMKNKVIKKIFEKYINQEETKKKTFGTGIGLYLSDYIVKAHGGYIEVSSKEGEGSVFRVFVPVH